MLMKAEEAIKIILDGKASFTEQKLVGAIIEGSLELKEIELTGGLCLTGVIITDNLCFEKVKINGSLGLDNVLIGGYTSITDSKISVDLKLANAMVRGPLELGNSIIGKDLDLKDVMIRSHLSLEGITIEEYLYSQGLKTKYIYADDKTALVLQLSFQNNIITSPSKFLTNNQKI